MLNVVMVSKCLEKYYCKAIATCKLRLKPFYNTGPWEVIFEKILSIAAELENKKNREKFSINVEPTKIVRGLCFDMQGPYSQRFILFVISEMIF
jgi:hypothetical protein